MTIVWLNGVLLDEDTARISPFDHGFTVGDGVFETIRVYGGNPFALRRHLDRLLRSAAGLDLPLPDRSVLERAVGEVVAANDLSECRLRLTISSGPGPAGSARGDEGPTVLASLSPIASTAAAAAYDVVVAPWTRNERGALTGLKTVSYAENARALAWAKARGAQEAIFANTVGDLCEGTGTNVFVGIRGRLITPPLSAGCLAGVTRDLVIELTGAVEQDVPIGALATAEEAFLSGTGSEIMPIASVDGSRLPLCPGPLTTAAFAAYKDLLARDLDP
jgi:branched-chain amino acid aminotransferase